MGLGRHIIFNNFEQNFVESTSQVLIRWCTVKPVLSGQSKIDKTTVLKTSDSLVLVKSIAECSEHSAECSEHSAILLACIRQLSVLKTYFESFLRDCLGQVLL